MNFTREPIIETIITAKEGHKLVLRNSKTPNQEEYFVDAVEIISYGNTCFYRCLEKPKAFVIPVSDYEVLEVRETRVVLKTTGIEKGGIKIGGGRESSLKAPKESKEEASLEAVENEDGEQRTDKRRDRKRMRKKRERVESEEDQEEVGLIETPSEEAELGQVTPPPPREERASLIPPPSTLISETLARYKETPGFSGAFYEKAEEQKLDEKKEEEKHILIEESDPFNFLSEEKESDEE